MMTCRIGINGFGRIGRMVLRRSMERPDIEVVAINDLADLGDLTYLLKYDSVHGPFPGQVSNDEKTLRVNGQAVQFSSERDAAKILAWSDNEWGYSCRLAELAGRLVSCD